ncbi:MAG TPA: hypothetical protein VIG76_00555 [Amnibacterium sp.]|uniref:hypothetical protein n=1 Tax=Amnibacterium sp. TaxID=1872496 RepID=UPI002F9383DA
MSRRSRLTALVAAITGGAALAVVLAGGVSSASASTSPATMLKSFDAGDIISDQVMFNPNTMTQAQVQSFLNSMVPSCQNVQYATGLPCLKDYTQTTWSRPADPMCGPYTGAKNETAAAIIVKVGKACNVNPQVLLVLLQKEQGLITDTWPTSDEFRKATGYGCPDSSNVTCDATYNGFYNQVYKAAWAFQRYTMPAGTGPGTDYYSVYSAYPVGRAYPILYQDPYTDSSCGSKSVVVKNKATHSLYYYTPYTPNAAALAAGYGSGDACSAYGNRNFFLYFTQWFGSTHIIVSGAIATYWNGHGGASGALGAATANAVSSTENGGGSSQTFQHGTVYTSKAGTFAITGAMLTEYNRRGGVRGSLQWPVADATTVTANGGGTMQRFGSGELYSSAAGTYAVREDLRAAYLAQGGVTGTLGFPTDNAATLGTGWVQHFTTGTTYFNKATGGYAVAGAVDAGYTARKGPTGVLGWPVAVAGARTAAGISGTVEAFQQGDLYVSSAGTAAVLTPVRTALAASPAAAGNSVDALGWPTADATSTTMKGGGTIQPFTGGRLYAPSSGPAVVLTGAILSRYVASGEVASGFGWPAGEPHPVSAHGATRTVQSFQTAAAYQVGSAVTTVVGATYAEYVAEGGPAGPLGWVTGAAWRTAPYGGVWAQAFSGGSLYYSSADKHTWPVTGTILSYYEANRESAGVIGRPLGGPTQVVANGATGTVQSFSSGSVYVRAGTLTYVGGRMRSGYLAIGGPSSTLGWPTAFSTRTTDNGGGWTETFQGGTLFYSTRLQLVEEVRGGIGKAYAATRATAGPLGWPTTGELPVGSTKVQHFQHGTITWRSGRAIVAVG